MLKVQLFGPGRAFYGDQPLAGFPGQQCYRLLYYLLLNREHPHHRERLAAVFWGDYATSTSRKYLRNALWRLRNALESTAAPIDHYLSLMRRTVLRSKPRLPGNTYACEPSHPAGLWPD